MRMNTGNAALDMTAPLRKEGAPKHAVKKVDAVKHIVEPPRLLPYEKTDKKALRRGALENIKASLKVILASMLLFAMFSTLVYERAKLIKLNSVVSTLQERLDDAQSEAIRLDSEFNNRYSIDSIEKYAREELGMVKRQKHQIHFFGNEGEDEIVLFDGVKE